MFREVDHIVMYGADWCGDCRRAKSFLDAADADYVWIDVEQDPAKAAEARRIGGSTRIPVVVFTDGSVLVEPTDSDLEAHLRRSA
jgi:mycoredoxin